MALRKVKDAESGVEFPFEPREVVVGETDHLRPISTYIIDWLASAARPTQKQPKEWPRSLRLFKRALDKTLDERGKRLRPFADGPEVLAAAKAAVRAEFVKAHPGDTQVAKTRAFDRAVIKAIEAGVACTREIDAEGLTTFIWRVDVK